MDFGEGVEDGAGRFLELNRTADFERAGQDLLGALQIPELDKDLAERRERDGETMARAERLVQRHASLREGKRLIMLMPEQRDVGLVVNDAGKNIVGLDRDGETLTLAKRGRRLITTA